VASDEEKRIFAKNLNKYMLLNDKQQVDVARDLGIKKTTLNMWCNAKSMPSVGKIQKLADYFRIGKSDLIDDKDEEDADIEYSNAVTKLIISDKRFKNIVRAYIQMPVNKRDLLCDFFENFII
jgi:transcriptional regulator with XRE-family HTH domain